MRTRRLAGVLVGCVLLVAGCSGSPTSPRAHPSAPPSPASTARSAVLRPRVYPLTGLPAASSAAARRTPLAVKIDNVYGSWPQAGLNQADLVYDILVEGGLTRLMAVYQSHGAPLVGPIRSARPVDAYLLRLMGGGYFAFSGASGGELRPVRAYSHAVLLYADRDPAPFTRRGDHLAPHNLFSSTARLRAEFAHLTRRRPSTPPVFSYATTPPQGRRTRQVTVPFPAATAAWTWRRHEYLRSQDGHPDVLIGGSRVSATNVVVMSVRTVGTGIFEYNGAEDPLPVTIGHGPCWVLRDGIRIAGTWQRRGIAAPLRLYDQRHHRIPLHPGRTWVELMPRPGVPRFS